MTDTQPTTTPPLTQAQRTALLGVDSGVLVFLIGDEEWVADHPNSYAAILEHRARLHAAFPELEGRWAK